MENTSAYDERMAKMTFASIYPHYITKIEKKWRTQEELLEVISWLTWYSSEDIMKTIDDDLSFEDFFNGATLNPNSQFITWTICGHRIEEIENPLTKQVRYLDKLVDELAKWKKMEKILRES